MIEQYDKWSLRQQIWIMQMLQDYSYRTIYNALIAEQSDLRPFEIPQWYGSYEAFRYRCRRLLKIIRSKSLMATDFGFDLETEEGRYQYWIWLAQNAQSESVRIQALQKLEEIMARRKQTTLTNKSITDWPTFLETLVVLLHDRAQSHSDQITQFIINLLRLLPDVHTQIMHFLASHTKDKKP